MNRIQIIIVMVILTAFAGCSTGQSPVTSSDGNLIWAKRAGGTNDECGNGITTLSDDSTVVTGSFNATATFGEGEANETVLVSDGFRDIFVARFAP